MAINTKSDSADWDYLGLSEPWQEQSHRRDQRARAKA